MRVLRPTALYRRLGVCGAIGLGEAYLAGSGPARYPASVLTPFAAMLGRPVPHPPDAVRRRGSAPARTCTARQIRKIDAVLDYAGAGPGRRLAEIGSGWGALAVRAAQRGAQVTALTNSGEQARFARERVALAGLGDRVTVLREDYRHVSGSFDAVVSVVSVEMIEAVGADYWPSYFQVLNRLVVPGGCVVLQTITMPHDRMLATRDAQTWIRKYVFPGGQVPSVRAVERHAAAAGLRITARRSLQQHYARTLHEWRDRFLAQGEHAAALGFDAAFQRRWEFYLAYCEAGFRAGFLDVWQFQLVRSG